MRRSALSLACALCISACSTSSLEEDIAELMAPFEPEALFVYSPAAEEEATEEEKKVREEIREYVDSESKYLISGIYFEELSKDHLHNQSYKERLAKAEELNGCSLKTQNPVKTDLRRETTLVV